MFECKIVEPLPANTWDWFGASIFLKKSHTILKELRVQRHNDSMPTGSHANPSASESRVKPLIEALNP